MTAPLELLRAYKDSCHERKGSYVERIKEGQVRSRKLLADHGHKIPRQHVKHLGDVEDYVVRSARLLFGLRSSDAPRPEGETMIDLDIFGLREHLVLQTHTPEGSKVALDYDTFVDTLAGPTPAAPADSVDHEPTIAVERDRTLARALLDYAHRFPTSDAMPYGMALHFAEEGLDRVDLNINPVVEFDAVNFALLHFVVQHANQHGRGLRVFQNNPGKPTLVERLDPIKQSSEIPSRVINFSRFEFPNDPGIFPTFDAVAFADYQPDLKNALGQSDLLNVVEDLESRFAK